MKTKLISVFLVLVSIVSLFACGSRIDEEALWATATYQADTELGEGAKTVYLTVEVGSRAARFTVHTDEAMLGDALLSHGLIEGDAGPYGLYLTKVNGIAADYDKNQSWWNLQDTNGVSMMTGISDIAAEDGASYKLAYTVG